ncbi:MAG: ATP-dependent Clp protease adaptor ClpS [Flavobacteriaceae bacterium]|nr:ATP-dependent Clp protease adaptor ClpS [Flavobacteriaceae bacterium]
MKTEEERKTNDLGVQVKTKQLMLYNDDINDFEFVMKCLKEACGHDDIQAEQCAVIIHYTGKCVVRTGVINELSYSCFKLLDLGLSAEVI